MMPRETTHSVVAIISPHYSGRRGCAHAPPQVVLHGFRPTVSIWLISFHIYFMKAENAGPYVVERQELHRWVTLGSTLRASLSPSLGPKSKPASMTHRMTTCGSLMKRITRLRTWENDHEFHIYMHVADINIHIIGIAGGQWHARNRDI